MNGVLTRTKTGDEGTQGKLVITDDGKEIFSCDTLELPWRNNKTDISCVMDGYYPLIASFSPKHQASLYHLKDVPGRQYVEIHSANLAGDIEKGYVSQLLGCLAPGRGFTTFPGGQKPAGPKDQVGILNSRATLAELHAKTGMKPFNLSIKWAPGVL